VYSGAISSYTVTKATDGYTVKAKSGTGGTDTLTNVEHIQFSDRTINLTINSTAAGVVAADVKTIEELYVAFFNRVPDADGLEYWISQRKAGQTIKQIADSFYAAGVQSSSVTGYSSSMTNADFVNLVYKNVLGRTSGADTDGLNYWTGALAAGKETKGSLVSSILASAHTFKGDATWGWVANLLDNKASVANEVALTWGLSYSSGTTAISEGMKIAAAVTATDVHGAVALVGVADGQIAL
jgi:hypothetical protein